MTLNDYKNSLNTQITDNNNEINKVEEKINNFGVKDFLSEAVDSILILLLTSLGLSITTAFAVSGLAPVVPAGMVMLVVMFIFSLFIVYIDYKGSPKRLQSQINILKEKNEYCQSELTVIKRLEVGETLSAYSLTNETKVNNFGAKNSTFDKNKRILKNIYLHTTNVIMDNDTSLRVSL